MYVYIYNMYQHSLRTCFPLSQAGLEIMFSNQTLSDQYMKIPEEVSIYPEEMSGQNERP